jgi:acyl-CoA hydrolase
VRVPARAFLEALSAGPAPGYSLAVRAVETSRELILHLASDAALRRRFLVLNEPLPGNLRFGVLLEALDRLAADTAVDYARQAHPGAKVVTAAVDEILVRHPADASRDLMCRARINHVGRSSMEVGLRVEAAEGPVHFATCYFTMVARSGDGPDATSVPVPPLQPGDAVAARREARATERHRAWRARQAAAGEPPSREEFELLAGLHRAQDQEGFAGLRAGRLVVESWERTYPEQENYSKVIFGGYIMRRAYELASICAERIAPARPVVAAVNRINFFEPVRIGDKLRFTASVVYTDGPAICVQTDIERHSRDRTARALSNSCLFTFANVTPQMRLAGVPPVHPATYGEDARWLDARRNLHDIVARLREGPWLGLSEAAPAAG